MLIRTRKFGKNLVLMGIFPCQSGADIRTTEISYSGISSVALIVTIFSTDGTGGYLIVLDFQADGDEDCGQSSGADGGAWS